MPDEDFQNLALKVLAHEASPEERAALEAELTANVARAEEFAAMREALAVAQAALPLADALEKPVAAELPAYRVGELRSAVRVHFRGIETERGLLRSISDWFETLPGRWVVGTGLAAVCALFLLTLLPGPSGIEVGYYAESATRSLSISSPQLQSPQVNVTEFESDQAFDQWLARPLTKNEKARVWLDNEHNQIHVRVWSGWLGGERTYTVPLPESDAARQAAVAQVIADLRK